MVHEVDTFISGTLQQLKDQTTFANKLQDRIEKVIVSRANPKKVTQKILHTKTMHKDWWFTPEEALDYGFIDFIAE